jgi:hypothetical protein
MIETIKLYRFWSNYAEDALHISLCIIICLGVYLLSAYFFVTL